MSNGSQQVTKVAPKHTHNDRRLSECQNKQVLRRPIFSIGQMPRIMALDRLKNYPKFIVSSWYMIITYPLSFWDHYRIVVLLVLRWFCLVECDHYSLPLHKMYLYCIYPHCAECY